MNPTPPVCRACRPSPTRHRRRPVWSRPVTPLAVAPLIVVAIVGAIVGAGQIRPSVSARSHRVPSPAQSHARTFQAVPPAWSELPSDATLAGHDAAVVVDGRMILHGGERDIGVRPAESRELDLVLDPHAWATLPASGDVPAARLPDRGLPGSRVVVDPAENRLLAVCDCREGNTFLLDPESGRWSRAPGDASLPLWYPLLAYDTERDRAVLYGGQAYGLGDQSTAEGWAYDLSTARRGWSKLPDAPFVQVFQAAGVEPESGHLVAFGGQDIEGRPQASLWRLDLDQADGAGAWRDITALAGEGPGARIGATLAFDAASATGILYGGYSAEADFGDVWLLDYRDPQAPKWSRAEPGGAGVGSGGVGPGERSGHSAVWDPASRRMIVYGGTRRTPDGGIAFLGDTWALALPPAEVPEPTIYMPIGLKAFDMAAEAPSP